MNTEQLWIKVYCERFFSVCLGSCLIEAILKWNKTSKLQTNAIKIGNLIRLAKWPEMWQYASQILWIVATKKEYRLLQLYFERTFISIKFIIFFLLQCEYLFLANVKSQWINLSKSTVLEWFYPTRFTIRLIENINFYHNMAWFLFAIFNSFTSFSFDIFRGNWETEKWIFKSIFCKSFLLILIRWYLRAFLLSIAVPPARFPALAATRNHKIDQIRANSFLSC